MNMKRLLLMATCLIGWLTMSAQAPQILSDRHAMLRINAQSRYLLLPIQEREEIANISILVNGKQVKSLNAKLAVDKVDYYVPLDLSSFNPNLLLDITFHGDRRTTGAIKGYVCWKEMQQSNTFDTTNREQFRPVYHHTPLYGWMNDPNGMVYQDGVWHLFYQYNPFGSQWENMNWGHSTSRDLIHWEAQPIALEPDALGSIFSGSCVIDKDNTAGFGAGAMIAMYTSAGQNQSQSIAYSTDGGKTFSTYEGNPVITQDAPDFRDPKVFWFEQTKRWIVVLAVGQEVQFYSSPNLKDWTYESSFGREYGNHDGVWECPDLLPLTLNAKLSNNSSKKWVLLLNINPGGPFGGSATQYFVGQFDGHKFTCEDAPSETKWMDYGKDHYATVTFSGAPNGRHVALAWMSNWQYAAVVPTHQYRSSNSVPRDLGIFTEGGEDYVSVKPSPEVLKAFNKPAAGISEACMVEVSRLRPNATIELSNGKGERVVMRYNASEQSFSFDRLKSGQTDFSDAFPSVTIAPTHGRVNRVLIFIDKSSIEVFDADGKFALTNLVFPTSPYNRLSVKGGKTKIRKM